jgi:hypothetical protein
MFLVREGEKLAFHHVQNQSGKGIFHPFLFHQAKPLQSGEGIFNPFVSSTQAPQSGEGIFNPKTEVRKSIVWLQVIW